VPDEKWGEQVAAVLRLRADFAQPTVAELTEFLRDQIAPHKIPVFWTFVDGLPMTPTGKTQKYVLRQQAADGTLTFDEVRPPKSVSQALGEDHAVAAQGECAGGIICSIPPTSAQG